MKNDLIRPVFLENSIQNYSWGERGPTAFIPQLLGIPAQPDTPYAELWIGAHPTAPSQVVLEGKKVPLHKWIAENPEPILGERVVKKFGPQLPFLLKVLSAAEALSIQVHPNKEQAERLHARDPEHYPDANHKPEIAIALDGLKALAGFKSFEETVAALKEFPEIAEFLGEGAALTGPEPHARKNWVRRVYLTALRRSEENPAQLRQLLLRLDARFSSTPSDGDFLQKIYLELRQKYGDDVGLLSLFLLRFAELKPGEAIFIDAGVPHAYLKGNIIECMANSDNVVRAGLTPKFKDVAAMEEVMQPEPKPVPVFGASPEAEEILYRTPAEEFRVVRLNLNPGQRKKIENSGSLTILLVVTGRLEVVWHSGAGENRVSVARGESLLVPARLGAFSLSARDHCLVFGVSVPGEA